MVPQKNTTTIDGAKKKHVDSEKDEDRRWMWFYNQNGTYGGNARTTQFGNTANTTYYNANGTYGGNSRTTTFGNQSTTQHYGANGLSTGRSVSTTFGNQTTTTHYNQYGQQTGTTTRFNNFGQSR